MVRLHKPALISAALLSSSYAGILSTKTTTVQDSTITPPPLIPGYSLARATGNHDVLKLRKRQTMSQVCGVNYVVCDSLYCCPAGNTCVYQFSTWQCSKNGGSSASGSYSSSSYNPYSYSFDSAGFSASLQSSISSLYKSMRNDPYYSSLMNNPMYSSIFNDPAYTSILSNGGTVNKADISSYIDSATRNVPQRTGSGDSSDPTSDFNSSYSSPPNSSSGRKKKSGISGAAIGGIIAGVIVIALAVGLAIFFIRKSKRNKPAPTPGAGYPHPPPMTYNQAMNNQTAAPAQGYYAKPPIHDPSKSPVPQTRPASMLPPPPTYQQPPPPAGGAIETEAVPWAAGIAAHQQQQAQHNAEQQHLAAYPTHAVETEARPWSQQPSAGTSVMSPVSPNLSAVGTGSNGAQVSPNLPPHQGPVPSQSPPPQQGQGFVQHNHPIYEMPGRPEDRSVQ